jgi:CheY-like chemotaxis protein
MGGALRVESQVEQGTLFWFELTLPVADLPVMWPKAKEGKRISGYAGATRRALVVDDDPLNRRLLQDILLELGFAVEIARGGEAAVALAEADPPDVIFMDLVMPDIGGLEAVRRLRRLPALAETVIVAVSASAFAADQERSRSVGCDDFLVKPLGMRTLQRCLQTHLDLEWIYTTDLGEETAVFPERAASAPLNSFTVPPLAEMETLLDLARRGDVGGVHQWAARVKGEEDAYAPFAERLIALAQQYDEKAILALTHRHLPERPFPAPHTPEEDPDDA